MKNRTCRANLGYPCSAQIMKRLLNRGPLPKRSDNSSGSDLSSKQTGAVLANPKLGIEIALNM